MGLAATNGIHDTKEIQTEKENYKIIVCNTHLEHKIKNTMHLYFHICFRDLFRFIWFFFY